MKQNNYFTKEYRPRYSEETLAVLNQKLDNALENLPADQGYPGVKDDLAKHIERKYMGIEVRYYFFDKDDKLIDRTVVASTEKQARKRAHQQGIKFSGFCEEANYLEILQEQADRAERAAGWDPTP